MEATNIGKVHLPFFWGGKANGCCFFLATVVQGDGNQEQLVLKYQGNCGLMAAKRASNHLFIRAIDQRMFGGQQACPNKTAAILAKLPSSTTSTVVSQNNNHHGLHMSSVENPYDILLYWLVNRDPYVMAYEIIPTNNWVGWRHPLYQTTNQTAHMSLQFIGTSWACAFTCTFQECLLIPRAMSYMLAAWRKPGKPMPFNELCVPS